jgi:hypothetical protein
MNFLESQTWFFLQVQYLKSPGNPLRSYNLSSSTILSTLTSTS